MKTLDASESIAVDLIDDDRENIRRTRPSAEEEAAFRECLAQWGQLQPILVMPTENGRYRLVAGGRRLRNAAALGWPTLSAIVVKDANEAEAAAMQAVENRHREPMHPIDTWQAMVALQQRGLSLTLAAQCLNVTEREAAQLDKLGRIAPPLIEAMRQYGIPQSMWLATIATASFDRQVKAMKAKDCKPHGDHFPWFTVAQHCRETRAYRADAIFDVEKAKGVTWQRDAFAEPGSRDEWTTTDVSAFLGHQRGALAVRVAAHAKKKEPVKLVGWDSRIGRPEVPTGFEVTFDVPKKLKLDPGDPRRKLVAIDDSGAVGRVVDLWVVEKAAARKKAREESAKAKAGSATPRAGDAYTPADEEEPSAAAPMTNAGYEMIAQAKTDAIVTRLSRHGAEMRHELLLRLLAVAICGRTVEVHNNTVNRYGIAVFDDIAVKLLHEDGTLNTTCDIRPIAADLISRIVRVTNPITGLGSGEIAEAVGRAISADEVMGAFDSAEFLKTLRLPMLEQARDAVGGLRIKGAGAIRKALEGKIGTKWAPPQAEFQPAPFKPRYRANGHGVQDWVDDESEEGAEDVFEGFNPLGDASAAEEAAA